MTTNHAISKKIQRKLFTENPNALVLPTTFGGVNQAETAITTACTTNAVKLYKLIGLYQKRLTNKNAQDGFLSLAKEENAIFKSMSLQFMPNQLILKWWDTKSLLAF